MTKYLLVSILGALTYNFALAQDAVFDVISDNLQIGQITTSKKIEGKKTVLNLNSKINYNIGVELKTEETLSSTFKGDTLLLNTSITKINSKPRYTIENKYDDKSKVYTRIVNLKPQTLTLPSIRYSYINLFFNAPDDKYKEVFSEIYGKNLSISKQSPLQYILYDPLGRKSRFYYDEKGNFVKAVITNSIDTYSVTPHK